MKNHQQIIEEFDEILERTENANELSRLGKDATFLTELEEHKVLVDGIRYASRNALMKKMNDWDAEITTPKGKLVTFMPGRYMVAATVLLAIAVTFILTYFLSNGDADLVARYYEPYQYNVEITRGSLVPTTDAFREAYSRKDYEIAINLYGSTKIAGSSEMDDFLYANACQALGKTQQAIPVYEELAAGDSPLKPVSLWYLALCQLTMDEPDNAKKSLKSLEALKSSYSAKATSLLEDMEK